MFLLPEVLRTVCQLVFNRALQHSFTDFMNLMLANKVCFYTAMPLLWKELPSLQPILHTFPSNVVVRFYKDAQWHYKLRRIPLVSDQSRLLMYAPFIQGISACGRPALNDSANDTFKHLFYGNLPFPSLSTLEMPKAYLLELPFNDCSLPNIFDNILDDVPPCLHTLAYVDNPARMNRFAQSIHHFPLLRNLTVSLLDPTAMQAIVSLTLLESLEIVIPDSSLIHATHPYTIQFKRTIPSLTIAIRNSRLFPYRQEVLLSAKALFLAFPASCHQLTVTIHTSFLGTVEGSFVACLAEEFSLPEASISVLWDRTL
ncbi:hypothetical protein DEU56DRAFT_913005 [Suillus clintonianus]|uniref:uncharacterized protein n=1 Tax=Suillus clintonianus TaxID=1904413 RepID=UPI001B87D8CB|nr:uncharacterized protein DEU56DRAFT_913005 [Suillus clintonianus]KAG2136425.1 hypothetical protein DEU56DRAFT_913005 [Suillus clintonianus]